MGEPFAMAGIYARGETNDDPVTFAILTATANELMAPIHERIRVSCRFTTRRSGCRRHPAACSSSRASRQR